MADGIEPLEPGLWFRRIEMIANDELGGIENSLRHAAHMAQLAPAGFRQHVGLGIDEAAFEALLDSGDFDTAARHLLPPVVSIERGAEGGRITAATKLPSLNRTACGSGETIASAILAAWTACLLAHRFDFRSN
jgi:hypothetical protein